MMNERSSSATAGPRLSRVALASFAGTLAALALAAGVRFAGSQFDQDSPAPTAQDRLQSAAEKCSRGTSVKTVPDTNGRPRTVTIEWDGQRNAATGGGNANEALDAAQCMASELRLPGSLEYPVVRMLSTEEPLSTQHQGIYIYLGKTDKPGTVAVFSVDRLPR